MLASFAFTLISLATKMPLFEWQFSEIVTDFSSACDGTVPSHWTTRFGEDLEAKNRPSVLENLNIVVKRSWIDESFDHISLSLYNSGPLLLIGVMLSISYLWWFLLQDKQDRARHILLAVFLTVIAGIICVFLSQVVRRAGPAVGQIPYYYEILDCHGAIAFNARLSELHYDTLFVLLASILSEVGVFVVMLNQLRIIVKEKDSLTGNNLGQNRDVEK